MANADVHGATIHEWTFAEYAQYARGRGWYVAAVILAVLLFGYAFATRNFLFAVILVMAGLVLYLRQARAPAAHDCAVTDRGVRVGTRFHAYDTLERFWVVDDAGPSGTLYLDAKGPRPRVTIPIADRDAEGIRATLRRFLPEDVEEDEPMSDAVARALKL